VLCEKPQSQKICEDWEALGLWNLRNVKSELCTVWLQAVTIVYPGVYLFLDKGSQAFWVLILYFVMYYFNFKP
jgi:hypothetical protein